MLLASRPIEVGPLFVDALRDAGDIAESEFSFEMNGFTNQPSSIDFGAPVYEKVRGGVDAMVPVPMNEDFFWSTTWQGVKFNEKEEGYHVTGEPFTIIDTGSSHMFLPPKAFQALVLNAIKEAGGAEFLI